MGPPRPGRLEIPGGHPRIFPGCEEGSRPRSGFPQRSSEPGTRGRSRSWLGPRAETREGGAGSSLTHPRLRGSGRRRPLGQLAGPGLGEAWGPRQRRLQGKSRPRSSSPPHVAAPYSKGGRGHLAARVRRGRWRIPFPLLRYTYRSGGRGGVVTDSSLFLPAPSSRPPQSALKLQQDRLELDSEKTAQTKTSGRL